MRPENSLINFDKPKTAGQWIVFLAAMGIALSSPVGTRSFLKELNKYLDDERGKRGKKYSSIQLSQALYYLKKRKIINTKKLSNGKTIIELTEKGRRRKLEYDFDRLKLSKTEYWDGKWRILMFDIPEPRRNARDALRNKLMDIGFIQFQKSVWLYPYPCQDEIDFISEYFSIAQHTNLITVRIENDKPLRNRFKL